MLTVSGAGVVALAGCTRLPIRDGAATARSATFGTAVSLGDRSLTLSNPRVRQAILADYGIWQEVSAHDGQYVVVEATTAGPVATRFDDIDLASVVDDSPVEAVTLVVQGRPGEAPRDPSKWTGRRLGFAFPSKGAEGAAIRWRAGEGEATWDLGENLREQLRHELVFELEQFDVSRAGDDVHVHLRVRNTGARDGRFLGLCSFEGIEDDSSVIELSVPREQSATFRGVPPVLAGVATDGRVVTLAYAGDDGVVRLERVL